MDSNKNPGILVVDDQPANRMLMAEYLEDLGLPVDEAESGKTCLEKLHQKRYSIVIMDIQMPGMTGFEVLEIMRKDEKLADIPVVFVSTIYDSEQYILKGINAGAIDFIAKPVNINILKSKVANFLKQYEKQAKLDDVIKKLEFVNQRLKTNEKKFKGITSSVSDSIILLDDNYRITFWNKASYEIFGYSKYEIISESFFEKLIEKRSQEILMEKMNNLLKSSAHAYSTSIRSTGIKKTGIEFPIELSLSCFITEGNRISYTFIIRDITHNVKVEKEALKAKELRETNRMMRQFINNVSHELRTPMNAILGISNMMLKYNSENLLPKQVEGLQIINQSGTRLLEMINDVLDIAKLEAGKVIIAKEEVDLEKLLASLRSIVISLIDKKDIRFIILKSPHVPRIIISDYKKLNQILLNILSNAVKFTPKGKIRLFIHYKEGKVIFEITDTGIGISKENLPIIFEKFRQIDTSESKEYKGTGLGLHITKSYVELLGGHIFADSIQDKGTTMTFNIPFEKPDKADESKTKSIKSLEEQLVEEISYKTPLAIIVDDNVQNSFWYKEIIKEFGYSVISFNDSHLGLMAIRQYLPDLVLIKLEMPKIHGQFLMDQLGDNELLKHAHFIIISTIESFALQNILRSYTLLNEPFSSKDLIKQLDKLDINHFAKPCKILYLFENMNHTKETIRITSCFHSISINSCKLIVAQRKIDELVLDGFQENGIHYNLIHWMTEYPEFAPDKITLVIESKPEVIHEKLKKITDNIPNGLKSVVEIFNLEETQES